jgi:hypothetical protein
MAPLVHWPSVLLHVCGTAPLHCVWPGAHTPSQAPFEHVWFVQALALLH